MLIFAQFVSLFLLGHAVIYGLKIDFECPLLAAMLHKENGHYFYWTDTMKSEKIVI